MAHIPKFTVLAGERLADETADPDIQGEDLEGSVELSTNASPQAPARLERKQAVIAQFQRVKFLTLKTVSGHERS
jgi:hypothetical protein